MSKNRNNKKSLDEKILSALLLISKNKDEGIKYIEFVRQDNMFGATELINAGYAEKINVKDILNNNFLHYRLTEKGEKYLNIVLKLAYKEFR